MEFIAEMRGQVSTLSKENAELSKENIELRRHLTEQQSTPRVSDINLNGMAATTGLIDDFR